MSHGWATPTSGARMLDRLMADLVVIVHLAFIVFVTAGGFLVLRRPWVALLHLPAVGWGIFVEISNRVCPLTPLEIHFRRLGGEAGYGGGFIDHYLLPVLYPSGLTRTVQIGLAILVAGVNVAVYGRLLERWRKRDARRDG